MLCMEESLLPITVPIVTSQAKDCLGGDYYSSYNCSADTLHSRQIFTADNLIVHDKKDIRYRISLCSQTKGEYQMLIDTTPNLSPPTTVFNQENPEHHSKST